MKGTCEIPRGGNWEILSGGFVFRLSPDKLIPMRAAFLAFCLLPFVAACATDSPAPEETDSAAAQVYDTSRIVTLGGPLTEITYALGMGESVVGTDRSSLYPEDVNTLPRLDVYRQTSPEGVLSLTPTLVVALEGTGPAGVVEQIRSAGVPVVTFPEATSLDEAVERIERLGEIYGAELAADSVVAQLRTEVAAAEPLQPAEAPTALFIYARGAAVVLVSGTGNDIDAALRLAGAENAVTAFEGFRPLTAEAVAGAAPDVIVLPERGLQSLGGIDGLLNQPGLRQTPAGENRRVIGVDDGLLLGFGPRVGQGIQDLARQLADLPTDG